MVIIDTYFVFRHLLIVCKVSGWTIKYRWDHPFLKWSINRMIFPKWYTTSYIHVCCYIMLKYVTSDVCMRSHSCWVTIDAMSANALCVLYNTFQRRQIPHTLLQNGHSNPTFCKWKHHPLWSLCWTIHGGTYAHGTAIDLF